MMIRIYVLLTAVFGVVSNDAWAQVEVCRNVEMCTRAPGDYSDGNEVKRLNEITLDLTSVTTSIKEIEDVQYGIKKTYKLIPLSEILNKYKRSSSQNLALLHFQNKMIIPIDLTKAS